MHSLFCFLPNLSFFLSPFSLLSFLSSSTPCSAQSFSWCSGVSFLLGLRRPCMVLGINPGSVSFKTNTLTPVFFLDPPYHILHGLQNYLLYLYWFSPAKHKILLFDIPFKFDLLIPIINLQLLYSINFMLTSSSLYVSHLNLFMSTKTLFPSQVTWCVSWFSTSTYLFVKHTRQPTTEF